jgi:hypothetical protein
MHEDIDISDMLKANPQIIPEHLEEAREMLRRLRASGERGRGYGLVPPFSGKRVSVQEGPDKDRRVVRLRSSSERA